MRPLAISFLSVIEVVGSTVSSKDGCGQETNLARVRGYAPDSPGALDSQPRLRSLEFVEFQNREEGEASRVFLYMRGRWHWPGRSTVGQCSRRFAHGGVYYFMQ